MEAATTATAAEAPAEPVEDAAVHSSNRPDADSSAQATDSSNGQQPPETSDERDESGRYLSREAAGYRRRLRETETERDDLRSRLESYERTEVERLAGDAGLQVPADIWQFGASLETLRGEDGGIDPEAVSGLVGEIVKDRPGLQARPVGDLGIGRGSGAAGSATAPEIGLSALLKPERR
jgi:hypothetical protein